MEHCALMKAAQMTSLVEVSSKKFLQEEFAL